MIKDQSIFSLTLSLPECLMEFCKVALTFKSVNEILWCDHSNETSLPVLTQGAICFSKFYKMKFANLVEICLWLHLAVKGLMIISLLLITLSLDKVGILLGENWCWSPLGLEGFMQISIHLPWIRLMKNIPLGRRCLPSSNIKHSLGSLLFPFTTFMSILL